MNNLEVITTTSRKYAGCFGFTEEEVFAALDEFGLSESRQAVKSWYDGFTFGNRTDIYNPWSILIPACDKVYQIPWRTRAYTGNKFGKS